MDAVFVGTGDLRMCMELAPGTLDGEEPQFTAALRRIHDAARAHKLPIMGFGLSPGTLRRRIQMGWSAFIVHGDVDAICTSAVSALESFRSAAEANPSASQHPRGRTSML